MDAGSILVSILILAALVESIIESVEIVKENPAEWKPYAGFVLGAGGTYLFGINFLGYVGLQPAFNGNVSAIVNPVLMGFLIMRHSGNVNKILEFLKYLKGLGVSAEPDSVG